MENTKEKQIPKWNVWITFVIFIMSSVALTLYAILNLRYILYSPGFILGNTIGFVLIIYFLLVIPSVTMWEYLRK